MKRLFQIPVQRPGVVQKEQQTDYEVAESTLGLFKNYFDRRIGSLNRELKEEEAKNLIKLKAEHSYKFKFTRNEVQLEFNSDINHAISKTKRAAESRDNHKTKDICFLEKIRKRNKSLAGWGSVKEYLLDDLASDTNDEERIRSPESRALNAKKNREQR